MSVAIKLSMYVRVWAKNVNGKETHESINLDANGRNFDLFKPSEKVRVYCGKKEQSVYYCGQTKCTNSKEVSSLFLHAPVSGK